MPEYSFGIPGSALDCQHVQLLISFKSQFETVFFFKLSKASPWIVYYFLLVLQRSAIRCRVIWKVEGTNQRGGTSIRYVIINDQYGKPTFDWEFFFMGSVVTPAHMHVSALSVKSYMWSGSTQPHSNAVYKRNEATVLFFPNY